MRARRVAFRLGLLVSLLGYGWTTACGDVTSDAIIRGTPLATSCRADSECEAEKPHCELTSGRCVECLERADCPNDQACRASSGTCVILCDDEDCSGAEPVCDESTGLCRACSDDGDCPNERSHCLDSGNCVRCIESEDCDEDSDEPFCDGSGRCVECLRDAHCDDADEACSGVLGECATPCSEAVPCGSDDPVCDLAIGFCVDCLTDLDCESDEICRGSECRD